MGDYIVNEKITSAGSRGHAFLCSLPLIASTITCGLPRSGRNLWNTRFADLRYLRISDVRSAIIRHWCSFVFAGRAGLGGRFARHEQTPPGNFSLSRMHVISPGLLGMEDSRNTVRNPGVAILNRVNLSGVPRRQPQLPAAKENGGSRIKGMAAHV